MDDNQSQSTACPDETVLEAFSGADVADEHAGEILAHLDACDRCQAAVETFSRNECFGMAFPLAQDVAALLSEPAFRDTHSRLQSFPVSGDGTADQFAVPEPTRLLLGRYRLLEPIARGGMGAVFKAMHADLNKIVAIKLLTPRRAGNPAAAERFRREMQALGRFSHPHVVMATDGGEDDGHLYLVMEYVEGIDLSTLVRRLGPLPFADACELIRQAALGVEAIHQHGLVHRDIKPSNIMLTTDGVVKVLDLGLSRFLVPKLELGNEDDELTEAGQVLGTKRYMAPEQLVSSRVDHRADLYSLGATLWTLLCGEAPTVAASPDSSPREIRPPFQHPDAPTELAAIVDRLTADDPAARFSTAGDLCAALQPLCEDNNLRGLVERALRADETPASGWPGLKRSETPANHPTGAFLRSSRGHPQPASPRTRFSLRVLLLLLAVGAATWTVAVVVKNWLARSEAPPAPETDAAGLIAVDHFEYSEGTLSGQGEASNGWSGAWDGTSQRVESPGLTYTDALGNRLVTAGNRVRPGFGTRSTRFLDLSAGSNAGLAGVIDAGSGKIGKDGSSVWIAFLARGPARTPPENENRVWAGVDLFDGGSADAGSVFFGKFSGVDYFWGIGGRSVRNKLNSAIPTTQQVLFVTQIEFARGPETLRVWLNPNLDAAPSPADAAVVRTIDDFRFDRIRIAGSEQFVIDELRIGTSFNSVAPVNGPIKRAKPSTKRNMQTQRPVAEWVIARGGRLKLHGRHDQFGKGMELPRGNVLVQSVDFYDTQSIRDQDLEPITRLPHLHLLNLSRTSVTDRAAATLGRLRSLHWIMLNHTAVSDGTLRAVASLPDVEFLSVKHTKISDAGLQAIAAMPKLIYLDASETRITDDGLARLATLPAIRSLLLATTAVTGSGLRRFRNLSNLKTLDLSKTRISDDQIPILKSAVNLKTLTLRETAISRAGLTQLERALPRCRVVR